jgi:hypothetical protein
MTAFDTFTWQAALAGRWTGRILGSLMVLFILVFVFAEGPPPLARMAVREQLYALALTCLFLGLILAWFYEAWGGLLSIVGWVLLLALARQPAWNLLFLIPAALGLLHLVCWWRLRGPIPQEAIGSLFGLPLRPLVLTLSVLLGIFLLLCVNEIFGQPPLMAGGNQPPAGMVGTWRANLATGAPVVFAIGPDGSVSGTVGDAALTDGRFLPNRSWFGRLMHWRTCYLIRGRISGVSFSAPLNLTGSELAGALFLPRAGSPKPLSLNLTKQ